MLLSQIVPPPPPPPPLSLSFSDVLLNDVLLQLTKDQELPSLSPAKQSASGYVELPPLTYGFYVFTHAKAPACM